MEIPDYIKITQPDIEAKFKSYYEQRYFELTGVNKTVQPAQAEQLMVNSGSNQIYLQALRVQSAALQNLSQFATYPALDGICEDFGVIRIPAQAAQWTVTLTLAAGHPDLVYPAGLRVQTFDTIGTFALVDDAVIAADVNSINVQVICDTVGAAGNGYLQGVTLSILDPQPYLQSAVSAGVSAGGADLESDENMRERLYLAPAAFSVAGSEDAYKFFARSASALILDVAVDNGEMEGEGGLINLYPLVAGGATPDIILRAVEAACNPKTVRPTSDLVTAYSPTVITYAIDISVSLYGSVSDAAGTLQAIQNAVQAVADMNSKSLGIDINRSELNAAARIAGVANVVINSPAADVSLNNIQVSKCTGVTIHFTGYNYDR